MAIEYVPIERLFLFRSTHDPRTCITDMNPVNKL